MEDALSAVAFGDIFESALSSLVDRAIEARLEARPVPRFLSQEALADHYGVPVRRVRDWREKGLPGRKVGKHVLYEVAEVDRWIEREGVRS